MTSPYCKKGSRRCSVSKYCLSKKVLVKPNAQKDRANVRMVNATKRTKVLRLVTDLL